MTDKPTGEGHNSGLSAEQLREIARLTDNIEKNEDARSAINAKINSDRKLIKALGIDLDAYRAAKRRKQMDVDKRAEFDRSQALVNQALGIPVQGNLFGNNDDNPIPSGATA